MQVKIRKEEGYDLALYGMSLSFKDRAIAPEDWWCFQENKNVCNGNYSACDSCEKGRRYARMAKVATANANRGRGHNKFRRQICFWIDVEAPRFWWSEADTYKVGTVAQSESSMHTLLKRPMTAGDLEDGSDDDEAMIAEFNRSLAEAVVLGDIKKAKRKLPEAYLQRRLVTCNYEVLAAVIRQRHNHKLSNWQEFIAAIYAQVEHPELLPKME